MRLSKRGFSLAMCALVAATWSGCTSKKVTEYVSGVSTQVQVPRDLRSVRVLVDVSGAIVFCQYYPAYDGVVQLPRSLGEFASDDYDPAHPITVSVTGYTDSVENLGDCLQPVTVGTGSVRVLKRSRQPYVANKTLFLPLALHYSCWDVNCDKDEDDNPGSDSGKKTCSGGVCIDAAIDPTKLSPYAEGILEGAGGACFSASGPTSCMLTAVPAQVVDDQKCIYAIPGTASAPPLPTDLGDDVKAIPYTSPGTGLNVQVSFDGGLNSEILDYDPVEGFSIPDPAKPQQFQLSAGLCSFVLGHQLNEDYTPALKSDGSFRSVEHRVTAIRTSGACSPKIPGQTLCTPDAIAAMGLNPDGTSANTGDPITCRPTTLTPPLSALALLIDDTSYNSDFYGSTAGNLLKVALDDPSYDNADLGLVFFPQKVGDACGGFKPAVDMQKARFAQSLIADEIGSRATGATSLQGDLSGPASVIHVAAALNETYDLLRADKYKNAYQRGVVLVTNRSVTSGDTLEKCIGSARDVADAARKEGIRTYVLVSVDQKRTCSPTPCEIPVVAGVDDVARAGGTAFNYNTEEVDLSQAGQAYDMHRPGAALALAQAVQHDLLTCAFDLEKGLPDDIKADVEHAVITFSDTTSIDNGVPKSYTVKYNKDCTGQGSGVQGWGFVAGSGGAPSRAYLCGDGPEQPCGTFRQVLRNAGVVGLASGKPSFPMPVYLDAKGCGPTQNTQTFDVAAPGDGDPDGGAPVFDKDGG